MRHLLLRIGIGVLLVGCTPTGYQTFDHSTLFGEERSRGVSIDLWGAGSSHVILEFARIDSPGDQRRLAVGMMYQARNTLPVDPAQPLRFTVDGQTVELPSLPGGVRYTLLRDRQDPLIEEATRYQLTPDQASKLASGKDITVTIPRTGGGGQTYRLHDYHLDALRHFDQAYVRGQ